MADSTALKDENGGSSLIATLNTDGKTIVRVEVNPTNHGLKISDGTSGTNHGQIFAAHDASSVPTLIATSSVDGVTPVAVYTDASGNLLVDSM